MSTPAITRFWLRVNRDGDCWVWLGWPRPDGYGMFSPSHGTIVMAHRYAYEVTVGPIPHGLTLDHLCRNRRCVNPSHLEPVTRRENTLRGNTLAARNVAKDQCPQGHPYDDANTYVTPKGHRDCKACRYAATRRWRQRGQ